MNIDLMNFYSALTNETRLRCLYLVSKLDEICVCDIVDTLDITQPTASKALHILKEVGLLTDRKDANWIYYRINQDMEKWAKSTIDITLAELDRSPSSTEDTKKIRKLVSRTGSGACP